VNDGFTSVALFSHNNGITDFINTLTTTKIDDMPTCGIFAIKINIEHWQDFRKAEKDFWFFDSPKKMQD
jgi:phosphohistidine phosphatase